MKLSSTNIDILKILAIFFMSIDHINKTFIHYDFLFLLGRIAFPIFAFLLVYNYLYNSKNKEKYIKRLFLFAFISQIPFYLLFNNVVLNILFTLAISLSVIHYILETNKNYIEKVISISLLSIILYIFPFFEYGLIGFLSILSFYFFLKIDNKVFLLPIGFVNGLNLLNIIFSYIPIMIIYIFSKFEINIKFNRKILSKVFYLFYPTHLFGLYFLTLI